MAVAALQAWRAVHGSQQSSTAAVTLPPAAPDQSQQAESKCFFDAGFCSSSSKAAFGAVLVSAGGRFIAACAGLLPICSSPLMAEALAAKEALTWLRDKGVSSVAVFTDCSQLRSSLASTSVVRSHAGFAIEATRALLSTFNSCVIGLVPRSANVIAHTLAAAAYSQISTLYWDTVPPNIISALFD